MPGAPFSCLVPNCSAAALRPLAPSHLGGQIGLQSNCVVVLHVVGAEHPRDAAVAGNFEDWPKALGLAGVETKQYPSELKPQPR